jgi:hypothetical protein
MATPKGARRYVRVYTAAQRVISTSIVVTRPSVIHWAQAVNELQFEWDEHNLQHVMIESPHGITPALLEGMRTQNPQFFRDARPGRSGSHLMIAPDERGRFWSVVLLHKGGTLWRPITGWPSTNAQIRLYWEATDAQHETAD